MTNPFDLPEKKKAYPDRSVVVRSGGHRHVVVDIDELLATITQSGGGTGGGVPVVDSSTGTVVAIAHPDPVDGVYTYVDPRTTVVDESSGQGRSIAAPGGGTVRVVIDAPSPTQPPPEEELPGPEPTGDFGEEAPVTQPRCTGSDCFVTVPCHAGFASGTRIPPQTMFSPTNLGGAPLVVMFAGPRKPPQGKRDLLQEVDIAPGMTGPNLMPPPGTDTVFIGCTGSGSVTFRFSIGVG